MTLFSFSPFEGGLALAKHLGIFDPLLKGKGVGLLCMVLVDGTTMGCLNDGVNVEAESLEGRRFNFSVLSLGTP